MSFTIQEIQGVPYWLDTTTNAILLYGSSPPLQLGTFNSQTKEANFNTTWKDDVKDFLVAYRQRLGEQTERELQASRSTPVAAKK